MKDFIGYICQLAAIETAYYTAIGTELASIMRKRMTRLRTGMKSLDLKDPILLKGNLTYEKSLLCFVITCYILLLLYLYNFSSAD